jgi:electron transfer flavoprotein alpha subunit
MPNTILVIAEQRPVDGAPKLNRATLETLNAAQQIAKATSRSVEVLVPGKGVAAVAQELSAFAIARVIALEADALAAYTAEAYTQVLANYIAASQPEIVLLPHTYQVRDFAPRLALALDRTLLSDCTGFRIEDSKLLFTRQVFQGKFTADISFNGPAPWLATFQIGASRGDQAEPGTAPVESVAATIPVASRVTPGEVFREAKQAVDLSQAEIIVAVGRGIKEQKNLTLADDLAAALGGEVAASRPICDAGWLPIERQIGSSGQTVAPKLYLSLGISGAIQHLVGMKGSRNIVAINKDAEAPIFEVADVGVVGDLFAIVPALTEEIKKVKADT